jgi:sec-independent protein translocase protein TatA
MLVINAILLFFDFSGGEFMLIAVVFLMFFGSKSIPGMARTLGKAIRDFKEAANTVQREIHESATVEEVKETPKTTSPPTPTQQISVPTPPPTPEQELTKTPESPKPPTNAPPGTISTEE